MNDFLEKFKALFENILNIIDSMIKSITALVNNNQ